MKDILVIVHVYRNGKNVGQQTRSSIDENVNHMWCDGKVSVVGLVATVWQQVTISSRCPEALADSRYLKGGYFFPLHISMS